MYLSKYLLLQMDYVQVKVLKKEGYHITATAIYTVIQGLLAIEAGADYHSSNIITEWRI